MNDIMKILLEHGTEHPSCTMNFADLTKGLFAEVTEGNINVNYHPEIPHLALFKYSQNCVTERNWNIFSLMARGLILDLKNKAVVASPFMKFFNFGEMESGSVSVIQSEYIVTEKVDGSLGIMFWYDDKWRVATAGSFMSEQAQWADIWIHGHIQLDEVDKKNTYLFEIIYPENKIVVSYDFSGLVLLGIIDSYGLEYSYEQLVLEAEYLRTRCAKQYDFDGMDAILKNAESLDQNHEGYVIRFKNGVRLKIKGDEYVRIHRLISRITPLAIWESFLNKDNFEDVRKDLPEELEKDFETILLILQGRLDLFIKEVESMYEETKSMSDKELGLSLSAKSKIFAGREFKESDRYIFLMRKRRFYESAEDISSLVRRKIFNAFRPTSNILKGYTPSSVVNRFVEETSM